MTTTVSMAPARPPPCARPPTLPPTLPWSSGRPRKTFPGIAGITSGPAAAPRTVRSGTAPDRTRTGCQAVDIRGAAIDVVERMGLLAEIRANDTNLRGMSYVDENGRRIAELDAAFGVIDERDVEISRGTLTDILHRATREDVEYVFDDSITAIAQGADGVRVRFEHGAPRRFDLVLGAGAPAPRSGRAGRRRGLRRIRTVRSGHQPRPGRRLCAGRRTRRRGRRTRGRVRPLRAPPATRSGCRTSACGCCANCRGRASS